MLSLNSQYRYILSICSLLKPVLLGYAVDLYSSDDVTENVAYSLQQNVFSKIPISATRIDLDWCTDRVAHNSHNCIDSQSILLPDSNDAIQAPTNKLNPKLRWCPSVSPDHAKPFWALVLSA